MAVKSFVKLALAFALSGVLVACSSGYHATGPVGLGKPVTENQIKDLIPLLNKNDIIVDGGNSNYKHSQRRGAMLAELGIGFIDCSSHLIHGDIAITQSIWMDSYPYRITLCSIHKHLCNAANSRKVW